MHGCSGRGVGRGGIEQYSSDADVSPPEGWQGGGQDRRCQPSGAEGICHKAPVTRYVGKATLTAAPRYVQHRAGHAEKWGAWMPALLDFWYVLEASNTPLSTPTSMSTLTHTTPRVKHRECLTPQSSCLPRADAPRCRETIYTTYEYASSRSCGRCQTSCSVGPPRRESADENCSQNMHVNATPLHGCPVAV